MIRFSKTSIAVIVLVLTTGCSSPEIKSIRNETLSPNPKPVETNLVNIKENGFSPPIILIAVGDTVTFQNSTLKPLEIASDPHPDDNTLPDFHSETLYKEEFYQYTFLKAGKFGYHLEDNPSIKGEVIVAQ